MIPARILRLLISTPAVPPCPHRVQEEVSNRIQVTKQATPFQESSFRTERRCSNGTAPRNTRPTTPAEEDPDRPKPPVNVADLPLRPPHPVLCPAHFPGHVALPPQDRYSAVVFCWPLAPPPYPHFRSLSPQSAGVSLSPPPPPCSPNFFPRPRISPEGCQRPGERPLYTPVDSAGWSGAPSSSSPGTKHRNPQRCTQACDSVASQAEVEPGGATDCT